MGFHDDLSEKVYELLQVAFVGTAYMDEDDRGFAHIFKIPDCDPTEIWEAYEPFFNTQDPEHGDHVGEQLLLAANEIYEAQFKHFTGLATSLEAWNGDAATAFKTRMEELWWSAAQQQRTIEEVAALYKGYQDLIRGTRLDILGIAEMTIEALKGYREQQKHQSRQRNMVAVKLLVVTAATVATAGIALPAAAAAGTAGALLTTSAVAATKTFVESAIEINALRRVEGDDPNEIVNSMFSLIRQLLSDTELAVEGVNKGFEEASQILLDAELVLPAPAVAYQPFNPEEFRVVSSVMPDSVAAAASRDPLLVGKAVPS